jgi:molybdopterin molybdotransferase
VAADFETRPADWLTFPEAVGRVRSVTPLPAVSLPLAEALGLAVALEVRSTVTLPPGPTSHMDGYAVRAADLVLSGDSGMSAPLPVAGTSRPGHPPSRPLRPGTAARVMTGGLIPEGADTVVPVEKTDRERQSPGQVRVSMGVGGESAVRPGAHVRPAGEEVQAGERLAAPGDTVTPPLLALVAVTGMPTLFVHPAPRVAILVTGDELVPGGDPEAVAGGTRRADVLSPTLPPFVRSAGGAPLPPLQVNDDRAALGKALMDAAAGADFVITTGGASMGEADLVKSALDDVGFELDFWRVHMRPGSPVSFGRLRDGDRLVPVLGLPGNPVSAMVTFLTLGVPALRTLGGHTNAHLPTVRATARERLGGPPDLRCYLRVTLGAEGDGRWGARLSAPQGSGAIRNLALADGLAVLAEGVGEIAEGESVPVLLLPRFGWAENS